MDRPDIIRSSANAALTLVRSLQRRDGRDQKRAFVVEGQRAVIDALESGSQPRLVLMREGTEGSAPERISDLDVRVGVVAARLFDTLTDTVTSQGVLAVFSIPEVTPPLVADAPLALVVDRIRDPGNLGTLLRAAAAAEVSTVYLSPGTVDAFNPKVVRAGMGAHFRVPLRALDGVATSALIQTYPLRVVAAANAATPYDAIDWRQPAILIIGSEAEGVGSEVLALGTISVSIPLAGGIESLNAGVAGAVILFEARRHRRRSTTCGVG